MIKRLSISLLFFISVSFFSNAMIDNYKSNIDFVNSVVYAQPTIGKFNFIDQFGRYVRNTPNIEKIKEKDQFCKSKLLGSMSKESCYALCPGGPSDCQRLIEHKAEDNPEISEDTECWACDSSVSCYDLGLMYNGDCGPCNANPLKACVTAVAPGIGPPIATPLPKDSDGVQCWTCIDVPDSCPRHWGGSTLWATCDANCKNPNKCKKVGVNPDNGFGCYACVKPPPPPPKTCHDVGLRYKGDCAKCPAAKPDCRPAIAAGPIKDVKGKVCYECFKKKVNPPPPPPPKNCSEFGPGWQKDPCKCKKSEKVIYKGLPQEQGPGDLCCKCEPRACYPNYTKENCKKYCEKYGGTCVGKTTERGKETCYECRFKEEKKEEEPPKSCSDLEAHTSCTPNPCRGDLECEKDDVVIGWKDVEGGKKEAITIKCGFCVPKDEDPTACENHTNKHFPLHRLPSCSQCYKAGMACEEAVVDINQSPALRCAKCITPRDQRCPYGTIEGGCFTKLCADEKSQCVAYGEHCHKCIPLPERCPKGWRPGGCQYQIDACPANKACVEMDIANRRKCHKCDTSPETCQMSYRGSMPAWQCKTDCEPHPEKKCITVGKAKVPSKSNPRQTIEADCQKCVGIDEKLTCNPEFGEHPAGTNCGGTCVKDMSRCMPIVGSDAGCESCQVLSTEEVCGEKVAGSHHNDPSCNKECPSKLCKEVFNSKVPRYKCYACAKTDDEPPPPLCEDYDNTYSSPDCNGDCHDPEKCLKSFAIPGSGLEHCYECQEPAKCEDDDNRYSNKHCNLVCESQDKVCRKEVKDPNNFLNDDLECWTCQPPTCDEIPGRYEEEDCRGACGVSRECFPITDKGIDCYYCKDKAPKCNAQEGKYTPGSNCGNACKENERCGWIDGDDSGCQACIKMETWEMCYKDKFRVGSCPQVCPADTSCQNATREGCHECKGCGEYGLMKFCDSEFNCEEGSVCIPRTPKGTELFCYDCKKKEVGGCSVERGEFPPGKNCYDMCDGFEQKCVLIPGNDNKCETCDGILEDKKCVDKGFDESGECDAHACSDDEVCRASKDKKCFSCIECKGDSKKGTCKEVCGDLPCMTMDDTPECVFCGEALPTCEEEKKHSKNDCGGACSDNQECVPDPGAHGLSLEEYESWKGCWVCMDKPKLECDPKQGQYVGGTNCGGACDKGEKCKATPGSDYGCDSCQRESCEDFGAVDNVYDCSCDPDNCREIAYVDLPPEVGPCYRCECSYGFKDGECPQECPSGQTCEVDKGFPKCHQCVKAPEIEEPKKCKNQGEFIPGTNCLNSCEGSTECKPIPGHDELCEACSERVCPSGFTGGQCPLNDMSCSFGRSCIQQDNPDCHKCVTWDSYCEEPTKKGDCPQECPDGSYCENVGLCYWCKKGEDPNKCPDGHKWGTCESVCKEAPCLTHSDYPNCHTCGEITEEQQTCPKDSYGAGCGGLCDKGFECVPLNEAKERSETDWGVSVGYKFKFGNDFSLNLDCYTCAPKKPECEKGFEKGTCTSDMCAGIGKKCINSKDGKCHKCDKDHCYYAQRQSGTCKPKDPCEKGQKCEQVELSGQQCYWCMGTPTETCDPEKGEFTDKSCGGRCDLGYKCEPGPKDGCFSCVEDPAQTCNPDNGEYTSPRCGGTCDHDETCLPAPGKLMECFTCKKDETPKLRCPDLTPQHLFYNQCATCTSEGLSCQFKLRDDYGASCYLCEQKEVQECPDGYAPQKCHPYACPEGKICVEREGPCMICKDYDPKEDNCVQMDYRNGRCPGRCDLEKEMCIDQKVGNQDCYECINKNIDDIACRAGGYEPGPCVIADCEYGSTCKDINHKGFKCHKCIKREDTQPPPSKCDATKGEHEPGSNCSGQCSSSQECRPIMGNDWGCEACFNKGEQNYRCDAPYVEGGCPSGCSQEDCHSYTRPDNKVCSYCMTWADDVCYDEWAYGNPQCDGHCSADKCYRLGSMMTRKGIVTCYGCREVENPNCDYGYKPGVCYEQMECSERECFQTTGPCYKCEKGACNAPYFKRDECGNCYEKGGKCVPANNALGFGVTRLRSVYSNTNNCWKCEYPQSCEKYGEVSMCSSCPPGTRCTYSRTLSDSTFGEFSCYKCLPYERTVITEYIYIIITEDKIIVIVVKDPITGELKKFVSKSVMGLAPVKKGNEILNSQGQLKPITDFVKNGFGPMGLLNSEKFSMDQLSGILKQGVEGKRDYSEDCFSDFRFPPDMDAKEKKKAAKKKKSAFEKPVATEEQYKQAEESGNPAVSGPIVACGDLDGEKALTIFDAKGKLLDIITPEILKENPGKLTDAIKKATDLSQKFFDVKVPSVSSLIEKNTGFPVGKVKQWISKIPVFDKKGRYKEGDIVPNDPFYIDIKKAKKKLLGFLGSSTAPSGDKKRGMMSRGVAGLKLGGRGTGAALGTRDAGVEVKDQYALHRIGFLPMHKEESAWNALDATEKNVVVAVIDSGFDFEHPDSPKYVWTNEGEVAGNGIDDDENGYVDDVNGWNFVAENNDLSDLRGHGTHVAGIIAAKWNNGIGIAGINPGAIIMPVKVADDEGATNNLHLYRGIMYAVNHGARVINISLGGRGYSEMVQSAIDYAHRQGAFIVVASGNEAEDIKSSSPANTKSVLNSGSMDFNENRSTVSNSGPNNGLLAPGESVYSLVSKSNKHVKNSVKKIGYYPMSGTSFAAPQIAATASLILAKNPDYTNDDVENILYSTTEDLYTEGWDALSGFGLINAALALRSEPDPSFIINKFTGIKLNRIKKKLETVDVFATVKGDVSSYHVEVGKGKRAKKFKTVCGSYSEEKDGAFICRIDKQEHLRGSTEWVFRIIATNSSGKQFIATNLVDFEKN